MEEDKLIRTFLRGIITIVDANVATRLFDHPEDTEAENTIKQMVEFSKNFIRENA